MLFQFQHLGKVVPAQLHCCFADFLAWRRDLRTFFQQKDALAGNEGQLARQRQTRQPAAKNCYVNVTVHTPVSKKGRIASGYPTIRSTPLYVGPSSWRMNY